MNENGTINKEKTCTPRNNIKKQSYNSFKNKKPLKNIDNNTSYASSDEEDNSINEEKKNSSPLKDNELTHNKKIVNEKNKENNIKMAYTNNLANQGLYLNKPNKNISQYNIPMIPNANLYQNNNLIDKMNFTKTLKLNYDPAKNILPNTINNQNFLNNTNNNYQMLNNNIQQINNLNQFNNLIASNQNKNLNNNNNTLLINNKDLNQQLNNNITQRTIKNSPSFPIGRLGIGLDGNNSQNFFNNANQPRITNIPIVKRYGIGNNINIGKERLTTNYNDINKENTILNYQNNFPSNLKLQNNLFPNNRNTPFPNHNIINNNNFLNNIGNNIINSNYPNSNFHSNIEPISNQISNHNITNQEMSLDDILNNHISKNNLSLNDILVQGGNNDYNTNIYMNTIKPNNVGLTQFNNNYIGESQNNYENQFFKNYSQPSQEQIFPQGINYTQNLQNTQGRVTLRDLGVLSRPGREETGATKTNQDSFVVKRNINNMSNFNIFGVLDGHGPHGHFVSKFASQSILNKIINNPEIQMNSNIESIYNILKRNNYQIIKQSFISTDNQLHSVNFDSKESGTTCCLIIHIGNHLICANVGDSRAIAVYDEQNDPYLNFLRAIPLSIDYKPEIPEEKERIIMAGGLVEQLKGSSGFGIGPYRVFAPGKDYPGLAMSRSIGDLVGKQFGIIPEPGIIEYNISNSTKFIILCSDGVWEFLTNETVRDIGRQFYLQGNAAELCQDLVSRSVMEWEREDSIIDDITAIVLFF